MAAHRLETDEDQEDEFAEEEDEGSCRDAPVSKKCLRQELAQFAMHGLRQELNAAFERHFSQFPPPSRGSQGRLEAPFPSHTAPNTARQPDSPRPHVSFAEQTTYSQAWELHSNRDVFLNTDTEGDHLRRRTHTRGAPTTPDESHEWSFRHLKGFTAHEEEDLRRPREQGLRRGKNFLGTHKDHSEVHSLGAHSLGVESHHTTGSDESRNKTCDHLISIRFGTASPGASANNSGSDIGSKAPHRPLARADTTITGGSRAASLARGFVFAGLDRARSSSSRSRFAVYDAETQPSVRETMRRLIISSHFDYVAGLMVVSNAIMLGIQTDLDSRGPENDMNSVFRVAELCFCVFFTCEIALRIFVHRWAFFLASDWKWNVFDMVLISFQVLEELATLNTVIRGSDDADEVAGIASSLVALRILRVMRIVRIIRLVRIMRLVSELRTLVMSIVASMRSLAWAVALLFLIIYIVAVYLTALVTDHKDAAEEVPPDLLDAFGSLSKTIFTLFASVSGGLDWANVCDVLISEISPMMGLLFSFYIAFVMLAMMNVVTGVFTETALLSAKKDKDIYLINHVRSLFQTLDFNNTGMITWAEIEEQLNTREMQEYFKAIDVDISEAQGLFRLLDLNDSGEISAEDFLNGCIRIRGPARALETMLLLRETSRVADRQRAQAQSINRLTQALLELSPGGPPIGSPRSGGSLPPPTVPWTPSSRPPQVVTDHPALRAAAAAPKNSEAREPDSPHLFVPGQPQSLPPEVMVDDIPDLDEV